MADRQVFRNRYLFYYAHEHLKFRFPELRSLCKLLGLPLDESQLVNHESPFLLLRFDSEEQARSLVRRSVLMKSCFECWAEAKTFSELLKSLKELPADITGPYTAPGNSFRLRVTAFGKKLKWEEIGERIKAFSFLPFGGPVDLINPCNSFHLLEAYPKPNTAEKNEDPHQVAFGRWIADGEREVIDKFRLDQRYFIGRTSMDPTLALVMANQAMIKENDLVCDPFVGTGSLLIAAAHFGAYVFGGDIDATLLHGRGRSTRAKKTWRRPDESVLANFRQYKMENQYLDVIINDATKNVLREDFQFDAIITDPPYGIREATAQVRKLEADDDEYSRWDHGRCDLNDIMSTLIIFAAKHLKIGGRLVYWLPAVADLYDESAIPRHESLNLVSDSEQPLAGTTSRRLITMEKVKEWKAEYKVTFNMDSRAFRERYFTAVRNLYGRQKQSAEREIAENLSSKVIQRS